MIFKLIVLALPVLLALIFLRELLGLALFALVVCLAAALLRTLAMKPTAAKTAKPPGEGQGLWREALRNGEDGNGFQPF